MGATWEPRRRLNYPTVLVLLVGADRTCEDKSWAIHMLQDTHSVQGHLYLEPDYRTGKITMKGTNFAFTLVAGRFVSCWF